LADDTSKRKTELTQSTDWSSTGFLLTACTTKDDAKQGSCSHKAFHDEALGIFVANAKVKKFCL